MIVQLLKCFGAAPGNGNAALVVENDGSSEAERQDFARARQVSACVFLDRQAEGGIVLDYFYPHTRSPLCLHATLAAAHVLLTAPGAPAALTVSTAMRGQALQLLRRAEGIFIGLAPQPAPAVTVEKYVPSELMGQHMHLLSPPVIASVGSPKLLLEVADRTTLRALRPNLELIADWSALQQQRSDDRRRLARDIREAITHFEPRLLLGEVEVNPLPDHPQRLSIRLLGELRSGLQHWPVAFVIEPGGEGLEVRHERLD